MPVDLDLNGSRVLLDGVDTRTAGTVHALLAAGADVVIRADQLPTTLRDLVERRLLGWQPASYDAAAAGADTSFDVIIRNRPDPGSAVANGSAIANASAVANGSAMTSDTAAPGPDLTVPAADAATRPGATPGPGAVVLVGGGPGDPGLLTLAGLQALRSADVVVYDRLAPLSCLDQVPSQALLIDVGKIPRGPFTPQERINAVLVDHASQGRTVVRFKGGDNFVFGRGGEEVLACQAAGIPVTVIPGVSASIAAPALAGIPVTHRSLTQGFTVVSGHLAPDSPDSTVDWTALARSGTTLVVLMGVAQLPAICAALLAAGMDPDTPAAAIADAGLPSMSVVRGQVHNLPRRVDDAAVTAPAVTVIGPVAGLDLAVTTDRRGCSVRP